MSTESVSIQNNPFITRFARQSQATNQAAAVEPPTDLPAPPNVASPDDTWSDAPAPAVETNRQTKPTVHPRQTVNTPHHGIPDSTDEKNNAAEQFQTHAGESENDPEADQNADQPDSFSSDSFEPTAEPETAFVAAWEVEVFDVPRTVSDLFFNGELFNDLANRMATAIDGGLRSMAITSLKPGQGRSTVAIGIALAAASQRRRVALVDADTNGPTLMNDLGIDADHGWLDAIRGDLPITETAIAAVQDGVTFLPLIPTSDADKLPRPDEIVSLADRLSDHFDLIIIDSGPATDPMLLRYASAADSAIVVRDAAVDDQAALSTFCKQLTDAGVKGIGLVENFS